MKLEDLLRTLSEEDRRPARHLNDQLIIAGAFGLLAASLLVLSLAGTRPDWAAALLSRNVQIKAGAALLLIGSGVVAVREAVQPEASSRPIWALLTLAPSLVLGAGIVELWTSPASTWRAGLLGTHPKMCVAMVPLLSLPALGAVLLVMRGGAARSPSRAGALAGLLCGALGASAYMLRCTDDAPQFVITWYGAAVLIVSGIGAVLGKRLLRW